MKVKNPILPGFYPDPSICRVGEDYYMVNSTFAYFPGVPVFHSRNLADWEQIGNVLDRDLQVPLAGCAQSEGIFAPTIRWHQGTFYMITTNVSAGGNFIVTADRPQGPWSEPHFLGKEAAGIDPSLFFDEDGSCYYIGQRERASGPEYYGDTEIWIQRLDAKTLTLQGEPVAVLDGFQKNAVWPEGPHLYHIGAYYYILHAESGTAFHHCIVAARSKNVFGPYEYCPCNPILTHRHLGAEYPVTCVGHGDLVDDGRGNWYMVMLACRPTEGHTLLGRETFLAKVVWEDGWPVVNPGIGHLQECVELPGGAQEKEQAKGRSYTFHEALPPEFLSLRNHRETLFSLKEKEGCLRLFMRGATLKDRAEPAYLAVRQQHKEFDAAVCFSLSGSDKTKAGCAGMALMQNNENHIRVECFSESGGQSARVIRCAGGKEELLGHATLPKEKEIRLKLSVRGLFADVFWYQDGWRPLARDIRLTALSTESAGGFVGCTVGMYASGNGADTGGYADFTSFSYQAAEDGN